MVDLEAVIRSVSQNAGPRPKFLREADNDQLLSIILALAGQLAAMHERVDTLERVLESAHGLDRQTLDTYAPSDQVSAERLAWDEAFVRRMLRGLMEAMEGHKAAAPEARAPRGG